MADVSMISRLEQRGMLKEVQMNEVRLLSPQDRERAIGTKELGGCSVIVVIGRGIILAHISPRPTDGHENEDEDEGEDTDEGEDDDEDEDEDGRNDETTAGEQHFAQKLREVVQVVLDRRDLFDASNGGSLAWGIFARLNGEIGLHHLRQQASTVFSRLHLPFEPAFYDVHIPRRDPYPPAKGTVFATMASEGQAAQLFVEDVRQQRLVGRQSVPRSEQASSSSQIERAPPAAHPSLEVWVYDGSVWRCRQDGRTRTEPPINVRLYVPGRGYVMYDGRQYVRV